MHITEGLQNPTDRLKIKLALKAIEMHSGAVQKTVTITCDILQQFHDKIGECVNSDKAMLWAAMTLAHFGCMRTAEFVPVGKEVFKQGSQLVGRDISFCRTDANELGMQVHKTF